MALKVCKLSGGSRSRICKEDAYVSVYKGYFADQSSNYIFNSFRKKTMYELRTIILKQNS